MNQYINDKDIKDVVKTVIDQLSVNKGLLINSNKSVSYNPTLGSFGIFESMEDAINSAFSAQKQLMNLSLQKRKEIIQKIRSYALGETVRMSKLAVEETGYGRVEDKIEKNKLAILKTPGPEDIPTKAYTGDNGLTLEEYAPYGLIGSISPSTNPSETVLNNSISMLSAGNAVVFNPHPAAKRVSQLAVETINKAIIDAGGPTNCVTTVYTPTLETGKMIFTHPKIRLLTVTGGPAVIEEAMKSTKKTVAAGPGNPPVVVDDSANIEKAAKSIVLGSSLDNTVLCIAEKEIIVMDKVVNPLIESLKNNNAYQLSSSQMDKLSNIIIESMDGPGGEPLINRKLIGRNANVIAKEIGLNLSDDVRLLFAEVDNDHPLVHTEQLLPVIPLTRVNSFDRAVELAFQAENKNFHTAMIHSLRIDRLTEMGKVMNCSIYVKNGPSCAGLAFGGEGPTTFTIASPTGDGITTARTFTRKLRCAMVDYLRIL